MSDERPRPKYGEYATPEEQQARMQGPMQAPGAQPAPGASPSATPYSMTPPSAPPTNADAPRTHLLPPLPGERRAAAAGRPAGGGPAKPVSGVERVVTLALLGIGAASVLLNVPAFLTSWGEIISTALRSYGAPAEIVNAEHPTWPGLVISLVLIGVYIATAWWSLRRLRAGRSSWWVPLVGAVVAWSLVMVVMAMDPSLAQLAQWIEETGRSPFMTPGG